MNMGTEIVKSESGALEPGAWHAMREQAKAIVASGFLPKAINTPEKALTLMLAGRELGLGPMQSIRSLYVVDGKPVMSADLMAALVHRKLPGAILRVAESGDTECTVEAARPGSQVTLFAFSLDDAKRADLLGKDNWKKYPRAMLRARCLAEAVRATFPDCLMGVYDPDELGAVTNEVGEIVTVEALPRISPHGNAEPGQVFERTEDECDAAVSAIQDADSLAELSEALRSKAWENPTGLEKWHPDHRKAINAAYTRRKRQLEKVSP